MEDGMYQYAHTSQMEARMIDEIACEFCSK